MQLLPWGKGAILGFYHFESGGQKAITGVKSY